MSCSISKSTSTSELDAKEEAEKAEIVSLFQCPVCVDYALPPIFQCGSGHILCAKCRAKICSCPTCRKPLGHDRNLALEKLSQILFSPCSYADKGCTKLLLESEKLKHEYNCGFRPYTCPHPSGDCKWTGTLLEHVIQHLRTCHRPYESHVKEGGMIVLVANKVNRPDPGPQHWYLTHSFYGQTFMLGLTKLDRDGQFFPWVKFIGLPKQSEKYVYRWELNLGSRSLAWESTPLSIHDDILKAIRGPDCLGFDSSFAQNFLENEALKICFFINDRCPVDTQSFQCRCPSFIC